MKINSFFLATHKLNYSYHVAIRTGKYFSKLIWFVLNRKQTPFIQKLITRVQYIVQIKGNSIAATEPHCPYCCLHIRNLLLISVWEVCVVCGNFPNLIFKLFQRHSNYFGGHSISMFVAFLLQKQVFLLDFKFFHGGGTSLSVMESKRIPFSVDASSFSAGDGSFQSVTFLYCSHKFHSSTGFLQKDYLKNKQHSKFTECTFKMF